MPNSRPRPYLDLFTIFPAVVLPRLASGAFRSVAVYRFFLCRPYYFCDDITPQATGKGLKTQIPAMSLMRSTISSPFWDIRKLSDPVNSGNSDTLPTSSTVCRQRNATQPTSSTTAAGASSHARCCTGWAWIVDPRSCGMSRCNNPRSIGPIMPFQIRRAQLLDFLDRL